MDQISLQEVKVYRLLSSHPETWFSNRNISAEVKGVALRTVRACTRRFFDLGLVEKVHVFPGDRFRFSVAPKKNKKYIQQLEEAAAVLSES